MAVILDYATMFVPIRIIMQFLLFSHQCLTEAEDMVSQSTIVFNGAYVTKRSYASVGPKLDRFTSRSMLSCGHRCLKHPNCASINYEITAAVNGLCELSEAAVVSQEQSTGILEEKPGFVFVQLVRKDYKASSCLDHLRAGSRFSGHYTLYGGAGLPYPVYCDLTSEVGEAWTLFMSEKTPGIRAFGTVPLFHDKPTAENDPNWNLYRLSLARMKYLASVSSHWRVTCSFQLDGLVYRDYVRANISEFDPIKFKHGCRCMRVEYINVRGHECKECLAAWWQNDGEMLHHDSSSANCGFDPSSGAVHTEDDFGYYGTTNSKFRCTELGREATTNHWFGSYS